MERVGPGVVDAAGGVVGGAAVLGLPVGGGGVEGGAAIGDVGCIVVRVWFLGVGVEVFGLVGGLGPDCALDVGFVGEGVDVCGCVGEGGVEDGSDAAVDHVGCLRYGDV